MPNMCKVCARAQWLIHWCFLNLLSTICCS